MRKWFGMIAAVMQAAMLVADIEYENPVWKADAPDPTVWRGGDRWYAASTHQDILESRDLVHWEKTGRKLLEASEYAWIARRWPHVWAPDVVKIGEWYNLYLTFHNEGDHTAIAAYRSKSPMGPFVERALVRVSEEVGEREIIDPEVVADGGRVWLFYGHGDVRRIELTADGRSVKEGATSVHVAGIPWEARPNRSVYDRPACSTEGAYLHRRGGWWYLFVSEGSWMDHTYRVAVGRSATLDGEFVTREGKAMKDAWTTPILTSEKGDSFFGPGHNGEIFTSPGGHDYIFYHCHWTGSASEKDVANMQVGSTYVPRPLFLQEIFWDAEGWPYFGNGGKPQRKCTFVTTVKERSVLENESLRVEIDETTGNFRVRDKRAGRSWTCLAETNGAWRAAGWASRAADGLAVTLEARSDALDGAARLTFALDGNELVCTIDAPAQAAMRHGIGWPAALEAAEGERILLPHGCGYAFPVEKRDLGAEFPDKMKVYTRNFNLGMWAQYGERKEADGSVAAEAGYVALLETPEDAGADFSVRANGLRQLALTWTPDRGKFGYARTVRYVFQKACDVTSAARRYRQMLEAAGEIVTLETRKRRNPRLAAAIDDLAGAPNVWYWEIGGEKAAFARELKKIGFRSFLFGFATRKDLGVWRTAEEVAAVAAVQGAIPCEYDIYQDTMESRYLDKIEYVRPYWSTEAADADDIVYGADGKPVRGWKIALKGEKDGSAKSIGCAIICEQKSPGYAAKRLAAELQKYPGYRARFLDVSGTGINCCYNPKHPHGRRESAMYRRKLFSTVEDGFGLICGTEDNLACFVPVTTYTEGVMSAPAHYRVGGGRRMWELYEDVPDRIVRGMDETCRVPLWELVFHGCTVSYWYWCDYNNKFVPYWWKKDLFNALYGTPPMYFFNAASFARQKGELAHSYEIAATVARETAFVQMTGYRYLTWDRSVQETCFANGVRVTVNFGEREYVGADGRRVAARSRLIERR